MTLSKIFLTDTHNASRSSSNPNGAITVMKHIMNHTVKELKAEHEVDLLKTLIKKRLQPNNVATACKRLCDQMNIKQKEKTIASIIMRENLHNAQRKVTQAKQNVTRIWRENKRTLAIHQITTDTFNAMWRREKKIVRRIHKEMRHKKVTFLLNKSRTEETNSKRKVSSVLGIITSNQVIPPSFESKPRIYDGTNVEISKAESSVLSLGPKFAIFEDVDPEDIEVELEKSLVKLRWDRMNKEQNDDGEEEIAETQIDGEYNPIARNNNREWPYNSSKQTMNLAALRPTDLPFNKDVRIPDRLDDETENKMQSVKNELTTITKQYLAKNQLNNEGANLTGAQKEGLASLSKREDIVILQTDKSGRLSVDSKTNYVEASKPHYEKDIDITQEVHEQAQKEANGHSIMWTRILKAGENTNKGNDRIKTNMLVENNDLASLYTLRKDHKECTDANKGPPVRPVCGATNAYNNKLSHLLSMIIKPLNKLNSSSCSSSEEMMASIQQANEKGLPTDTVVGSLDVKALYPSLDVDLTARVIANTYMEHSYEIINVDYNELSLYLAINMSPENLASKGLSEFCPTRKHKRGRKPVITGCATNNDADKRYAPWNPPQSLPNNLNAKKMLAEAIYIGIKFTMSNHIYRFDDQIKKQAKGGPIGLELTGEVALIFMAWWDKQFKTKLRENNLQVYAYQRYVDDINIIVRTADNKPTDSNCDSHTLNMIKNIGDDITPCIKLEADYPSNHEDNKLPILDMKVWPTIKEETFSLEGQYSVTIKRSTILHEFYQKGIANKSVIHAKSAMSFTSKRTMLTQDILRVLLRCSPHLPWNQVLPHLNHMMTRIQYSGYSEKFRKEVTTSAIQAYDTIRGKEKDGIQPMYRPKNWNVKERAAEKRKKRENWFRKKGENTVIFIPATPHSELKKGFDEAIRKSELKIKIIERAGKNLKNRLQRSNPFAKKPCNNVTQCVACEPNKGSNCRKNNVTYEFKCDLCGDVYVGETSRNLYTRGKEHMYDYSKKNDKSVLYRHAIDKHSDNPTLPTYQAKITGIYTTALTRQIAEATKIGTLGAKAINSKLEWRHTKVTRSQLVTM